MEIRPIEHPAIPPFMQWSGGGPFLSRYECDRVLELGDGQPSSDGTVGNHVAGQFNVDLSYRCVSIQTIEESPVTAWLFTRILTTVQHANRLHFRQEITGIYERLQLLRYEAARDGRPDGHYRWHQDFGGGICSNRKLSLSIQLSDPGDYDGGELELFTNGPQSMAPFRGRGDAVLFPSWTPHRVTPVTRGVRYALVVWISGPQVR